MRLKAPESVGDPCVAGVPIAPRNGVYEVEAEIGALLMECFGFVELEIAASETPKGTTALRRSKAATRRA